MNYLLVNYVPFRKGSSPNRLIIGDMWLEYLRSQVNNWLPYGRLRSASPWVNKVTLEDSGSFNLVEIDPANEYLKH
jgi:hypothetical protein